MRKFFSIPVKVALGLVAIIVAGGGLAFFLLRTTVEMNWDWPETVRGEGEGVEQIMAGADGQITAGDRARARERALWKAYYKAQLRLNEQLGGLKIDATTTISDTQLADQELKTAFSETIKAAAEVESERFVEDLEDAVRARVVVEAPQERVLSLRKVLISALASGTITLNRKAPVAEPEGPEEPEGPDAESAPEQVASGSEPQPSAGSSPPSGGKVSPPARPKRLNKTGCVLLLARDAGMVGAVPEFYDSGGSLLGSALELPAERITAGIVIATAGDTQLVVAWAGVDPLELAATVSQGNLILHRALDRLETRLFKESLGSGRIVLVLEEDS